MPEPLWRRAVDHVAARTRPGPPLDRTLEITVHLHPDRLVGGRTLLDRLADDGVYLSQFVTGTSNGGLTAFPGGDRWRWEHEMFGGVYDDAPPPERPVYGSLDHRRRPSGGSVRFGSAHLRLADHVRDRTTFCYPDSVEEPTAFGTAACMPLVELADRDSRDPLDDYVEAHVHGGVVIRRDVVSVVLDPSFASTPVAAAAERLGVAVAWHPGFRLDVDTLAAHADHRGPAVVALGVAIADDGWLTPRTIGEAAARDEHDPQLLKWLWHCVARYGAAPFGEGGESDPTS